MTRLALLYQQPGCHAFISSLQWGIWLPRELDLIDWLQQQPQSLTSEIVRGIGDDAAIVRSGHPLALSQDMLVEGVHFHADWISPWLLGCKSLRANLSDLAAMAASPLACLLSLGLPSDRVGTVFEPFMKGFLEDSRRFECPLIGGDLSASPCLSINVTVLGQLVTPPIGRDGAGPGDRLAVVGPLGASGRGLALVKDRQIPGLQSVSSQADLERLLDPPERDWLLAHFLPQPQLEAAAWLARHGFAEAMMDLSDGLAQDVEKLARASQTRAIIELERLGDNAHHPVNHEDLDIMLHSGEDYSLLFAVPADREDELSAVYPAALPSIHTVGYLELGPPEVWLEDSAGRTKVPERGFEHFK